jgi:hypothetical protein
VLGDVANPPGLFICIPDLVSKGSSGRCRCRSLCLGSLLSVGLIEVGVRERHRRNHGGDSFDHRVDVPNTTKRVER